MFSAAQLHRDVGLDIAADVRRVAVVLGLVQVLMRDSPDGRLERVDLRKNDRQIERA